MSPVRTIPARGVRISQCRSCASSALEPVLDLGTTPLADRLPTVDDLAEPEPVAPLEVVRCNRCSLLQLTYTVDPEELFCRNYPYFSSVSPQLMAHFEASSLEIIRERRLGPGSRVIELASNDGYMLRHFASAGIPVLGIDPASGPAQAAIASGIPTLQAFFTLGLAEELVERGDRADVVLANNVLAHVADLDGFVRGIETLLAPDGVAVIEAPYLVDLVNHCEFDTIYHQHLCYFSVTALDALFRPRGLYLERIVRTSIHGGSLRLFLGKKDRPDASVGALLEEESKAGIGSSGYYHGFAGRVRRLREELLTYLAELRRSGKRLAGYGAAAKACTLLSYCGIGTETLEYVVDASPRKHGRFMPGNRLPIVPPSMLHDRPPDVLVILAWNFSDEIMRQQQAFAARGGRFLVPVPRVRIVAREERRAEAP